MLIKLQLFWTYVPKEKQIPVFKASTYVFSEIQISERYVVENQIVDTTSCRIYTFWWDEMFTLLQNVDMTKFQKFYKIPNFLGCSF
jgi:hypothetical protein